MLNTFKRPFWPCNKSSCLRPARPCRPQPPLPPLEPCCEPCCEPPPCCPPPRCCPSSPCRAQPRAQVCGRDSRRCLPACLTVTCLPCGLCGPFTLLAVEPCGEPAVQIRRTCRGPSPFVAEVTIPLTAWVCDGSGCRHAGSAEAVMSVRISEACACGPGTLMASADVRLQDPGCPSRCPTFDARLAVCAEVFRICMGPCGRERGNERCFDTRPMFPQPWW